MEKEMRGYCVDIVMCIDATAGMAAIIEELKACALSFCSRVADIMEEAGKSLEELRVKVITFRDYKYDADPMVESDFFVLPDQNAEFSDYINHIEACGGGDVPENALEAIALALKSDWTTAGWRRRHIVLVFSDAPALPLGERSDCPNYPAGLPKDIAQLESLWHGEDLTLVSTYQPRFGRLVAFVPEAEPWTALMHWKCYWPVFLRAGTMPDDFEMQMAIDLVVRAF